MKHNHAADEDIEEQDSLDRDINQIRAEIASLSSEMLDHRETVIKLMELIESLTNVVSDMSDAMEAGGTVSSDEPEQQEE